MSCVTMLCLESLFVRSNRISMWSYVTVLSLEFLFVRSNRISMCRITVLSLESPVSQRRISMCRITLLSLEFLVVRSSRGRFFFCADA